MHYIRKSIFGSLIQPEHITNKHRAEYAKNRFHALQLHLKNQEFTYDLRESPVEVQPNRVCFDQTQRFITQLMLPDGDHNLSIYCAEVQPPPRTLQEMTALLNFGPTLLFGDGLAQPDSHYIGPHAVAVLAMLENFAGNGPQLLLYDGDDTLLSRKAVFQQLAYELGDINPEELTAQMLREADLHYLFFRLEPALLFMENYAPRWCRHHVIPKNDKGIAQGGDGWGACVQYLPPDQVSSFLSFQTQQLNQTVLLTEITRDDVQLRDLSRQ